MLVTSLLYSVCEQLGGGTIFSQVFCCCISLKRSNWEKNILTLTGGYGM